MKYQLFHMQAHNDIASCTLMYMYIQADEEMCSLLSYRTNPKANVTLSGKKKRLLVKEARRMLAGKAKMEGMSDA